MVKNNNGNDGNGKIPLNLPLITDSGTKSKNLENKVTEYSLGERASALFPKYMKTHKAGDVERVYQKTNMAYEERGALYIEYVEIYTGAKDGR